MRIELPKRIYQSRPDLILNIDNEYMTFLLMDEIRSKSNHCFNRFQNSNTFLVEYYRNSAVDMPKRHYLSRFCRDMKGW